VKYIVEWTDDAVREYQAIQRVAADKGVVYRAAEAIDEQLQEDAETKGESREEDLRILWVKPVGVLFRPNEEKRKVFVVAFWRTHRYRPPPEDPTSES
jgi:hypothetical protein